MNIVFLIYKSLRLYIRKLKSEFYTFKAKQQVVHYGKNTYCGGPCSFCGTVSLGDNCNFNGMKIIGLGSVMIGNNFHSGIECMIITSNHDYDTDICIPYGDNVIKKKIIIEDNVWFGNRVLITGNVTIGEGAIIGAGTVVTKNIPKYAIVGGNPAKILKYRNIDHYLELKNNKMFH
ncbi:MAG: acyltransferase [Muribaculaceae bacterium]|nr:acyltransferase [Muribaculaceae bacterium]